jgi:putative ATP-dependent endonuclease of OLD family
MNYLSESITDVDASLIMKKKASKATAGQQLGLLLENIDNKMILDEKTDGERVAYWRTMLPPAVIEAIIHVTPNTTDGVM